MFSETSGSLRTVWHYSPEDRIIRCHRPEYLRSSNISGFYNKQTNKLQGFSPPNGTGEKITLKGTTGMAHLRGSMR
jgi:hypothetical protein